MNDQLANWLATLEFERWMFVGGVLLGIVFGYAGWLIFGPVLGVLTGIVGGVLGTIGWAEARANRHDDPRR